MRYNGANIFVNRIEIYDKFKVKDCEINAALLFWGNFSKRLLVDNAKKTRLYGYVFDFPVYYDSINVDDISDIHKYLLKKYHLKNFVD